MKQELRVEMKVEGSKKAADNVEEVTEKLEDLEKQTEEASEEAKESFREIGESAKTGFKAAATAITGAAVALAAIGESTRDYRTAQAKLQTAFESAGGSAETATQTYKDLNKILGDSDVAVEAAGHLAKLTTNEQELEKWTDACTGVFATFGDSLPIEGLTEAVNHTAKLGEVQGSLADALEWSGVSVDDFNTELANCSDEQERQQLILDELTKLYGSASDTFKETNKDIIAANEATDNWNQQMANLGGHIEPAITSVKNLGASLLEDLDEPIEDVSEFIVDTFVPAIEEAVKWLTENKEMVLAIGTALIAAKAAQEGYQIATGLAEAAQKLFNATLNANPVGLVVTAVAALTAGLIAYSVATGDAHSLTNLLTEEEKALIEAIDGTTESINERKTAYEEAAGTIQAEAEYNKGLADELLKLVDAQGKVKEGDEARVNFILNQLNSALDTEYAVVGGVIQQYDDLKTKIYEVINAKTANALLEAKNEAYVEAIQNEDAALQQLVEAEQGLQVQEEELNRVRTENTAKIEELEKRKEAALRNGSQFAGVTIDAEIAKLQTAIVDEEKVYNEKKRIYDDAATNYGSYYDTITEYEDAAMLIQQGHYEDAIDMLKNKSGAYFDYADDVDKATQEALDSLYKEAIDTGIEAKRIKQNFEDGVEGYTEEMVKEAEQAHEDALAEWENAYNEAHGIGGDMGDGLKEGLESKRLGLLQKARNLISSIWNAMRNEADSHSPSRKTMALGGDIGKGLEIGMDKSADATADAAKDLVQKSLLPIQASVEGVTWNNLDGSLARSLAPIGNVNVRNESLMKILPKSEPSYANTPIVLQVDGKTFAETTINTMNARTKQLGKLDLIVT